MNSTILLIICIFALVPAFSTNNVLSLGLGSNEDGEPSFSNCSPRVPLVHYKSTSYYIGSIYNVIEATRKVTFAFWSSGRRYDEDEWMWVSTGIPVEYANWNPPNEPTHNPNEDCILMSYNHTGKTLVWVAQVCAYPRYFICEIREESCNQTTYDNHEDIAVVT
ncbi:unnamed protein product [Acanthoscelides obtectus]|uniref:C-type lectin domain-containing protein n=1 Tax=Acanthoscelides obtectus TaxID=200917 RepID=A0A9P0P986_ACAOB|nr:unnamed protein product [Acanthoscelides obtectus]CAK1638619.1 hypothetical protein AOBTE_LOCUS10703 [Acanthoscelides obtectus]